jgi:SAM-dependent methyltransferase
MNNGNNIKSIVPRRVIGVLWDLLRKAVFHKRIEQLGVVYGYFDRLEYQSDKLTISGWMLTPKRDFDSFALYINQHKVGEAATMEREDVAKVYSFISPTKNSGFSFCVHRRPEEMEGTINFCIVGITKGREIAKMEVWYRTDLYACLPVPPAHLTLRVTACEIPSLHLFTGMQMYKEFWTTVCKYVDPHRIKSMLDWGCGCGRIIGFFLKFSGIPRICGADIDAEAIAWCQDNLKPAEFSMVPPHPPTAYADQEFDLIISFSVFTHLSREDQFSWLKEMQRILAPGGLFLTTVHGELATQLKFPGKKIKKVLKGGIFDVMDDERLDGIAPKGYYRAVYQTKEYTLKEWSRYFEILEYKEGGVGHYQDVVVMMRRDPKRDGSRQYAQ